MENIFSISDKSYFELKKLFKEISFAKDEIFVKVGQRNNSEYFVSEGYCRSFLFDTEGNDITLSFYKSNSVLSPHITRTKNDQSLVNLQALTNLKITEFDSKKFLQLMIENIEIRNFGNSILLQELIRKTEKEISLVSLPARERLIRFRSEFSMLENLIPHPVIASYLGITNVSLSRLRKETMRS
jgi:CRP-like cAMP-binding protein